jgi:hypothetical protein
MDDDVARSTEFWACRDDRIAAPIEIYRKQPVKKRDAWVPQNSDTRIDKLSPFTFKALTGMDLEPGDCFFIENSVMWAIG